MNTPDTPLDLDWVQGLFDGIGDDEFRAQFAEWANFAVPLYDADMKANPPTDAERQVWSETVLALRHLPNGWRELLGFGDAIQYPAKNHRSQVRAARVAETYGRGLALLARNPGGVTLFGAHFCKAPHDDCPYDWTPRAPVDVAAAMAEVRRLLDAYAATLDDAEPLADVA